MIGLKELLLTKLRDINTNTAEFRNAAHRISHLIAQETIDHIDVTSTKIKTPFKEDMTGVKIKKEIVLVPILRAGMVLVPSFLEYFPDAKIGIIGCKRDEVTKIAHVYYKNLPAFNANQQIIVLDPMIATGGTALTALEILKNAGVQEQQMIFVNVICCPEGINAVKEHYPNLLIISAIEDAYLTKDKFIYPGIGDFGDRYFGF